MLALVLAEHPAQMTTCELVRAINKSADCTEDEEVQRAIRDLAGSGLLRSQDKSVMPTRAALHFDRLDS